MKKVLMIEICGKTGENHRFVTEAVKGEWFEPFVMYTCVDCTGSTHFPSPDESRQYLELGIVIEDLDQISKEWPDRLLIARFGELGEQEILRDKEIQRRAHEDR